MTQTLVDDSDVCRWCTMTHVPAELWHAKWRHESLRHTPQAGRASGLGSLPMPSGSMLMPSARCLFPSLAIAIRITPELLKRY